MKDNILKRISAIAMIPIIGATASSCSKTVDRYYNAAANYYNETFIKDNEFEISYEDINENIPMYMDENPLILVGRLDSWSGEINWFIGYLTYNEELGKVYFYDVEKKDKLDLAGICTLDYSNFFIRADELELPYDNHMPLNIIKKVTKSAKFDFDIVSMIIIDPETGKEKLIPTHDLELDVFRIINNSQEGVSRKLKK